MKESRILIIGALPSSLVAFRGSLIEALITKGFKVYASANGRNATIETKLLAMGVEYSSVRIARTGLNPIADFITLFDLIRLMQRVKPDVILSYTIKPVIYGSLAAKLCGIRNVLSMIEGLGSVFMPIETFGQIFSSTVAKLLYRISIIISKRVFFLNPDDLDQFLKERYVPKWKAVLLNGIGVDLVYYSKKEIPSSRVRFLMATRLLKDKGVREYVAAAKIILNNYPDTEFILAGCLDENPNSIKQEELDLWQREGIINYVGWVDDMRSLVHTCHVFVLPSYYREGTPRTLLEAMSMGRAIITTDAPGCRETVNRLMTDGPIPGLEKEVNNFKIGRNGVKIPIKSVESLAAAMEFFLKHQDQIYVMGNESRYYAEERYDVNKVNSLILRELEQVIRYGK